MGAECSSSSASEYDGNKNSETQVVLNVYDLSPINNYTSWFGFGVFHSGIEVHGKEYGFGAHELSASGVFEVEPRSCPASEYHGDTYHLIFKNCNHFTDDISWRLTGKHIPGWVNRLARVGALCSCLLPESLQVSTVKQLPEYHDCSENGTEFLSTPIARESTEIDDQEKSLLPPLAISGDLAFVKEAHH
ncbi:hypothetical protein CIPAW_04G169900 [Carya illinoinensis]|uniref:PPPDE domain-containing protein n=1 Tax=Carya illinoinensis TaxID=32201 RepID=A0A8T1QX62_CARIL|nr:hypothetical protein CIPAW_04G169900 [Carya illinoinensis]